MRIVGLKKFPPLADLVSCEGLESSSACGLPNTFVEVSRCLSSEPAAPFAFQCFYSYPELFAMLCGKHLLHLYTASHMSRALE